MLSNMLLVGLGAAPGSMLRSFQRSLNFNFPYGTLLVKLLRVFILGMLRKLIHQRHQSETGVVPYDRHLRRVYNLFCFQHGNWTAPLLPENRFGAFAGYLSVTLMVDRQLDF